MRTFFICMAASAVGLTMATPSASAVDTIDTTDFRAAVTVDGIMQHERALQRIANRNDGTRASGTPGYAASATYVKNRLTAAGYTVTEQTFTFPFFRELTPSTVTRVSPGTGPVEAAVMTYSGSGDVTGRVVPTNDLLVPPPATPGSTSGCEAADFVPASATAPEIALIQRGTCTFELKAANAQAAGYDAVLIMNEGQEGRTETLQGTLGRPFTLPVLGVSFATGAELFQQSRAGGAVLRVQTSTEADPNRTTTNILADSTGDRFNTIVVGAHLDSVVAGPGINDNGSGTSAILEIAEELAESGVKPAQKLRFAFWGAEELGLLGSEHYVENLSNGQRSRIEANLNFDMVGSPNYGRFIYDGDGSATPVAGPEGSGEIEKIFVDYFESQGLASEPTEFSGRSDYGPFIAQGIPAGGLFTGAEGIKTEAQVAKFGGTAGIAYDACYHLACDTIANVNRTAIDEMGDAAAHAVYTLALTDSLLGEDGPIGQVGPGGGAGTGGGLHDHEHGHPAE